MNTSCCKKIQKETSCILFACESQIIVKLEYKLSEDEHVCLFFFLPLYPSTTQNSATHTVYDKCLLKE